MNTLKITTKADDFMSQVLPEELALNKSVLATIGKTAINISVLINTIRPLLTVIIMIGLSAFSVFAQGNPFPTRGDQSLGNLVSGGLSILSWLCFAAGIASFAIIPIKMFMKSDWMNYLWSGLGGVGLWMVMGSLAWMLANNQDPNLPDLDM